MAASSSKETAESLVAPTIKFKVSRASLNLEVKAEDFLRVVKEEHHASFATYIVVQRARLEPESHDLCIEVLDKIGSDSLKNETLQATCLSYTKIIFDPGCLLRADPKEQIRLRNLGRWLRKLLARWSVEPRAVVEPNVLIVHAYKHGLLVGVVPFIFEILQLDNQRDACNKLPNHNPWTMTILRLLTEIYHMPNLKLCPKYEIKLIFKTLKVDMRTISSSNLLEGQIRDVEESPDFFCNTL